jgi:hypothetical protein
LRTMYLPAVSPIDAKLEQFVMHWVRIKENWFGDRRLSYGSLSHTRFVIVGDFGIGVVSARKNWREELVCAFGCR